MVEWERQELRPLFVNLIEQAQNWKATKVLPRTQKLGKLVVPQLEKYTDGKYRVDRNEAIGFFDAITKFAETDLPISFDHFTNLTNQYKDRITPYPHYSGIKVTVPTNFDDLDTVTPDDVPDDIDDDPEEDDSSTVTLM